jgi:tetratricopeptide (TPR) repeat protein
MMTRTRVKQAYEAVGKCLASRDDEKAMQIADNALLSDGKNLRIWSLKASVLEFQGRVKEAETWLKRACRNAGRDPRPAIELIEYYVDANQFTRARNTLAAAKRRIRSGEYRKPPRELLEALILCDARVAHKQKNRLAEIRALALGLAAVPDSGQIQRQLAPLLSSSQRSRRRR